MTTKNYFLFFVIKNIKQSVFREYFLVISYYFHLFNDDCLKKKKSYKHIRLMIKNKTLNTKIICKTYLKILKIGSKYFRFSNKLLFYKIPDNSFKKLFRKTIFQNCF